MNRLNCTTQSIDLSEPIQHKRGESTTSNRLKTVHDVELPQKSRRHRTASIDATAHQHNECATFPIQRDASRLNW